ncbi:DUF6252 family protein [Flagellimonas halotolerans]|uniref:DUF6252 family protein n=1 Tax=Flagellimonas halotolerans TaxID=3112164 RepID=A0ABU6IL00_9FLAO|nr:MULTISPECIES: DUF6252 family protein [unclassified Allomuricauda]MEC3963904.1 DUF6252 family protein [Muricauda sp. SYSU M86414]MEC4263774.1 DUF6252 family protein [Muricauda sp. SYSU M84420]
MRRIKFQYLLILLVLFTIGCNSDDDSLPTLGENTFVAQKDENLWEGSTELQLMENDTLVFFAVGEGLDNGVLMVKAKFKGVGSYTLEKEKTLYYDTVGGDVIVAQYTLQEPENAAFVVESYNESNGSVTGNFAFELFPKPRGEKSIEYFLQITEGRFRGTLMEFD